MTGTVTWRELGTRRPSASGVERPQARLAVRDGERARRRRVRRRARRAGDRADGGPPRRDGGAPSLRRTVAVRARALGVPHLDLLVDRRVLIPRPRRSWSSRSAIERSPRRLGRRRSSPTSVPARARSDCRWRPSCRSAASTCGSPTVAPMRSPSPGRTSPGSAGPRANVRVGEGSWFDALPTSCRGTSTWSVANPPYIADGRPEVAADVLDWEPPSALFAGADGLDADRAHRRRRAGVAAARRMARARDRPPPGRRSPACLAAPASSTSRPPDLAGRDRSVDPALTGCRRSRTPTTRRRRRPRRVPGERMRRRNASWCSSRFSATTACGVMCETPDSGSTSWGLPAARSAEDSWSVCAATTLSSARPWTSSSGRSSGRRRQQRAPVVRRGVAVGVAEVALGVVRVVEPPLGDRGLRRRRRGTRRVGAARRARRGSRRSSSRGSRPGSGRAAGSSAAARCSAATWSSSTGGGEVVVTARSHFCPRPGVPRPSTTTTAKPWSANHCEVRKALFAAHDPLGVRAAVGIEEHRKRRASVVPCGSSTADGSALAGAQERTFGVTSGSSAWLAISGPSSTWVDGRLASASARSGRRGGAGRPRCARPGSVVSASSRRRRRPAPDVLHRRVVDGVGEEGDQSSLDVDDGTDLEVGGVTLRRRRAAAERRRGRRGHDKRAVGQHLPDAGHELDPRPSPSSNTVAVVAVRVGLEHRSRAGRATAR